MRYLGQRLIQIYLLIVQFYEIARYENKNITIKIPGITETQSSWNLNPEFPRTLLQLFKISSLTSSSIILNPAVAMSRISVDLTQLWPTFCLANPISFPSDSPALLGSSTKEDKPGLVRITSVRFRSSNGRDPSCWLKAKTWMRVPLLPASIMTLYCGPHTYFLL